MGLNMRKRWGIVMLGCIIGASIGIGPLLNSLGCVRNADNDSQSESLYRQVESNAADSAEGGNIDGRWHNIHREERSATRQRSDSIRDVLRVTSKKTSGRKKRKKVLKGNNPTRKNSPERNLRDDRLD